MISASLESSQESGRRGDATRRERPGVRAEPRVARGTPSRSTTRLLGSVTTYRVIVLHLVLVLLLLEAGRL